MSLGPEYICELAADERFDQAIRRALAGLRCPAELMIAILALVTREPPR